MVLLQAFNGSGDTLTPTYVNLFGFWIVEIPLAWFLAMHSPLHVNGVYASVVVAQSVIVLISLYLFRKGNWAKAENLAPSLATQKAVILSEASRCLIARRAVEGTRRGSHPHIVRTFRPKPPQ